MTRPLRTLIALVAAILVAGGSTVVQLLTWPSSAGVARPAVEVQIAVLNPGQAYEPGTARV